MFHVKEYKKIPLVEPFQYQNINGLKLKTFVISVPKSSAVNMPFSLYVALYCTYVNVFPLLESLLIDWYQCSGSIIIQTLYLSMWSLTRTKFWFFVQDLNETSFCQFPNTNDSIKLDSCLTGSKGTFGSMVYHLGIPLALNGWNIVHLEMVNVLVSMKIWVVQTKICA